MKAYYRPLLPPSKPVTLRYDQLFLAESQRRDKEIAKNSIAIHLWTMYHCEGHGKKRLRRDLENYAKEFKEMCDYYEMGIGDYTKLCIYKLKEQAGVDLELWLDELRIK